MYYLLGILVVILCILAIIHFWKKRKCLCRLCGMSACEKYRLLNDLVEPLGYEYELEWDVFSSRIDAWQRQFGFGALYDRAASFFNMVYETLPVYFDYDGKTWLIQLWKGQYGICSGCEVGIYHTDRIITKEERKLTIFHAVDDREMLDITTELWRMGNRIASLRKRHWWLTTFEPGCFSKPSQLSFDISICFADKEMQKAFYGGLMEQGVDSYDIFMYGTAVFFHYPDGRGHYSLLRRWQRALAQGINYLNCRLFCFMTRCCYSTQDQILFLYFYMPFLCHHLLKLRRFTRKKG